MKRRWTRGIRVAVVGLVAFFLVFLVIMLGLFPIRWGRLWLTSLNVPGRVAVASVAIDPLLKLTVRDIVWSPEANPVLHVVALKHLVVHPSWGKVLTGHTTLSFLGDTGAGVVRGTVEWRGETVVVTVITPKALALSGPFLFFHKGISLKGTGALKADLTIRPKGTRPDVSGDLFLSFRQLRVRWASSPLGPLSLSFVSGAMECTVAQSIAEIQKIDFRGTDMTVSGKATLWLDPLTEEMRVRGNLFLRPSLGLAESNPRLNDALKLLPRGRQGYKLSF